MSKQSLTTQPTEPESAEATGPFVVGIGASAGGVEALMSFFEQVPPQSGIAYVIILHLSPDFDSQLAQILQNVTPLPVIQVQETTKVLADRVYVISPSKHLVMLDGQIATVSNTSLEDRYRVI